MILGSARVLITDQCSPRLFNCDIAMSKIFENRPVKNRTMRYAAFVYWAAMSHPMRSTRAYAVIILEDFHRRTFKVLALVLSAS